MTGADVAAAAAALRRLVVARAAGRPYLASPDVFARVPAQVQQLAVDREIACAVEGLVRHGWCPVDLFEVGRRRLDPAVVDHLLTVVATLTSRAPITAVDPRWAAQLAQLGVVQHRTAAEWAWHRRLDWAVACARLVRLLIELRTLPRLEQVLAPPGSYQPVAGPVPGMDGPVLREVRALLALAENADDPDEALALSAGAQRLLTGSSLSPRPGAAARVETRRLWLDAPYVNPKALLVQAVARNNRCFAVLSGDLGVLTLIGDPRSLDAVDLLSTSLLAQATRAMASSAARATEYGSARTRSYRQAFLVAFADRADQRLREAGAAGGTTAGVRRAVAATFPQVGSRSVRVRNADGLKAGRAAAERAELG